jgi:hypothetical protein
MPKIVKKKGKHVVRRARRRTNLSAGKVKKKVVLLGGLAILLTALFVLKPWQIVQKQMHAMTQGTAITMPKAANALTKSISLEPDKPKTVFLKEENGAVISLFFPTGAVNHKRSVSVTTTKDETGVIILPEGTKFLRPVSITFDLTQTPIKSDAPEKIDTANPRTTGKTHLYSVDNKGYVAPILIATGMETSVLVSGRTLFSGAYVLRTDDTSADKYANATLDNPNAYFFSTLEAAATIMGNNQTLTEKQQANAKGAVEKVMKKQSAPLFELYAAVVVNKYLEGKHFSYIPLAYAEDSLETQLRKQCTEETHTTETYVNAELLATLQGFATVAQLCHQTGDKVLRAKAEALFNNPSASFEEVMVMIGQVKSIEGTHSTLLTNMENKLAQVVDQEFRNVINNRDATFEDLQEVWERKEFTTVDPALEKELDRVTLVEARQQIEKILANNCPEPREIIYAKSLVIQYQLDDLKDKVAKKKDCEDNGIAAPEGGNQPPPPGGGGGAGNGGSSSVPEKVGTCLDPFEYSYNWNGNGCEVCYHVYTDDAKLDLIETKCSKYECSDNSVNNAIDSRQCKLYKDAQDVYSGKQTDPDWQPLKDDLPLAPLPPGDPPIPDTIDGSNNNNSNTNEDPPIPDGPDDTSNGSNSSNDGSAPQNDYDLGL